MTGLIGSNGAGKSTALHIVMGLLAADAGRVDVDGADVLSLPLHRKRTVGLGYLPQGSASLPELTVRENVAALAEVARVPRRRRRSHVHRLLCRVGLAEHAGRPAHRLSGGERRRLDLALALCPDPTVLLLDEPFAGLDPKIVEELTVLLRRLAVDGATVLVTDHGAHAMMALCDHLVLLSSGIATVSGTPEDVAAHSRTRELYLGDAFRVAT